MIAGTRIYDLLFLALREAGVVSLGDTVDAAISQEALLILNSIRARNSLGNKGYNIFDQTFTLPENRSNITLGTGGDITTRPARINQVTVISGVPGLGVNYQLQILPYERYQALPITNVVAIPSACYIDTAFPLQHVWFYPGVATGWSVRVMGANYIAEYEAVSDPFADPPEWFEPLYLELAVQLVPKYGQNDLLPDLRQRAASAFKHIKESMFAASLGPAPNGLMSAGNGFNFYGGR